MHLGKHTHTHRKSILLIFTANSQ
ncbi:unnamed protein product [Chironomus riparius]|uniref:Uncharacterized protein n=1 Tax=Chironomus riparius TaxID=315576 RepID=A0A9N9WU97_9DIPT|nr:unnamed protein product [Chironomus riparius]